MLHFMKSYEQLAEIQRLLRNLIRIGTVSSVNLNGGLYRVDTGKKHNQLVALAERMRG